MIAARSWPSAGSGFRSTARRRIETYCVNASLSLAALTDASSASHWRLSTSRRSRGFAGAADFSTIGAAGMVHDSPPSETVAAACSESPGGAGSATAAPPDVAVVSADFLEVLLIIPMLLVVLK